jgi:hypothetical protein
MFSVASQILIALLAFSFGIASLCAFRVTPGSREPQRSAWMLSGIAFTGSGFLGAMHSTWAAVAYAAGPASIRWDVYVVWAPVVNHGRGLWIIAFCIAVAVLAYVDPARVRRTVRIAIGWLAAFLVVGAGIGLAEGPFVSGSHFFTLAVVNLATILVLGVALLSHLIRDTMDRILWAALSIYWLNLAIGTLWMAANAWFDVPGSVLPRGIDQFVLAIACFVFMLILVVRYIRLSRQDTIVPTVLEHLRPLRVRSF